ncbi:MAG: carboxypeptidase-like regulatory domain-containing protein [Algoriphagus sp.]|uniref:carboxypeptidase-like regulatory domain-containing protein n=1 Tax=Algoriphagus sp. TaxID=1872435 RepID=UPI00272F5EA0|nr:carboxypeptidase-like regulatory domain-containing protein [Algoriphagus sp.]MDP2039567.1 carboxypeptidase-like regulatory domain-containing protein [Algoriphagus sp.]MDP3470413.1 carboxypeptidase-like regulatory domain-containing protein [Algoriphagus sp.]
MRGIVLLFIFIFHFSAQSQTITGTVKEKGSGLPLPFANVFVNNTTIGAATDIDGNFRITGIIPDQFELVASFVGYSTVSVTINRKGKQSIVQNFELELLEDKLTEIELKAKRDKSWERNLNKFKEVFLAVPDDPYGKDIEILNPWVLDFSMVKPDKGFNYTQATAQMPLQLVNKALGYQIDFYLQDFRMLRNASRFFGQAFYKNLTSEDSLVESKWKEGKELNYLNSVRHLALSLLLKNSGSQGFEFYQANAGVPKENRTNDFYSELKKSIIPVNLELIYTKPLGNGVYRIFLPERMEVHHLKKPWPNDYYTNIYHAISWIWAPSGYFDVDRNGTLLHPTQLVLSGFIGRQRMARSLPLDFVPDKSFDGLLEDLEVFQNRYITLNNLRETPWISLNKSFYYPGESLWLGGEMLYQNATKQDSLSRVVYVDVLNDQLKVVHQEAYPIVNGKIAGGLTLSDALKKGDYLLRAYTRWGLNYGERDIFQLPFPILNPNEIIEHREETEEELFGDIAVVYDHSISDSVFYRVLDLVLNFQDTDENSVDAGFLFAALEESVAVELDPKFRLENRLDWLDRALPVGFDSRLPFDIEYGISVEGKFTPDKKRASLSTVITVVRDDLEDFGQVKSDSSGRFWASGLQFLDTAQIAIAAVDEKRRPYGKVELLPFNSPLFKGYFPKARYQLKEISKESEPLFDLAGDFIQLEEFVKEEVKEKETMAQRNYSYGNPNQEIGPSDLETKTMAEILGLLRFNIASLKFRNYTYGDSTGSPLLIIDGVSMAFMEKDAFREMLLGFEPSQLLSIKVYNDNISNVIFGMAGYAGVIMIETKKGFRTGPDSDRKFNSEGFQIFPVKGFTDFPEFPKNPPADQYLRKKPTIYWDPDAQTSDGIYRTKVKVPYGVNKLRIRVEGMTLDGEAFYKILKIEI